MPASFPSFMASMGPGGVGPVSFGTGTGRHGQGHGHSGGAGAGANGHGYSQSQYGRRRSSGDVPGSISGHSNSTNNPNANPTSNYTTTPANSAPPSTLSTSPAAVPFPASAPSPLPSPSASAPAGTGFPGQSGVSAPGQPPPAAASASASASSAPSSAHLGAPSRRVASTPSPSPGSGSGTGWKFPLLEALPGSPGALGGSGAGVGGNGSGNGNANGNGNGHGHANGSGGAAGVSGPGANSITHSHSMGNLSNLNSLAAALPQGQPQGPVHGQSQRQGHAHGHAHVQSRSQAQSQAQTHVQGQHARPRPTSTSAATSPRHVRHARSLSTSPSPPPFAPRAPSSPVPSAHRRLSSASVPRGIGAIHALTPTSATNPAAGGGQGAQGGGQGGAHTPGHGDRLVPGSYRSQPDLSLALSRQTSVSGKSDLSALFVQELRDIEDVHPLQAQIDRLVEKCNQHELKFRSARSSFEHRVLTEFPSLLHELTKLDDRAEAATASIYAAIKATKPKFDAKLNELIEQGQADVDTIRERTTPWRDLLDVATPASEDGPPQPDSASANTKASGVYTGGTGLSRTRSGDQRRRVPRIERLSHKEESEDDRAKTILEDWGNDIIEHLLEQIQALKAQLYNEGYRRVVLFRAFGILACVVVTVLAFYGIRRSSSASASAPPVLGPLGPGPAGPGVP